MQLKGMTELSSFRKYLPFITISFLGFSIIGYPLEKEKFQFTPNDILVELKSFRNQSGRRDLELLKFALDRGYAGFTFQDPNIKTVVFKQIDALLPKADSLTADDLCNHLGIILNEVPDNHLQVQYNKKTCPMDKGDQNSPASVGPNYGLRQKTKSPWVISYGDFKNTRIPVVSLFSFPAPDHPDWKGFDLEFEKALKLQALILDLRGNSGGEDTKAFEIARRLIGDKFQTPQESKKTRVTSVAKALFLNKAIMETRKYQDSGMEIPTSLQEEEQKRRKDFEKSKLESSTIEFTSYLFPLEKYNSHLKVFNKPIFVLIDSECGSTGELLTLALKGAPNVTIIGQNTAGFLEFGNPGLLILPYSKLWVEIPITVKKFRKPGIKEKVGIAPDILVPPGEDAINYAIMILFNSKESFPKSTH